MTNRKDAEARAREVLATAYTIVAPTQAGSKRAYADWKDHAALVAMLTYASEVQREAIERAAKVAEDFPILLPMPDRVIPAYKDVDDFGEETGFTFPERVEKRQRLAQPTDIAIAIRTLSDPDHADVDGSRRYFADDITYAGARLGYPGEGEGQ